MVKKKAKKSTGRAAKALFSTGAAADMPKTELTEADLTDGNIDIMTLLVKCGLTASKSEARRAVQQGGVSVDGEKSQILPTHLPEKILAEKESF